MNNLSLLLDELITKNDTNMINIIISWNYFYLFQFLHHIKLLL